MNLYKTLGAAVLAFGLTTSAFAVRTTRTTAETGNGSMASVVPMVAA